MVTFDNPDGAGRVRKTLRSAQHADYIVSGDQDLLVTTDQLSQEK